MKFKETIGIDISKKTIDVHLYCKNHHRIFLNNNKGFRELIRWVIKVTSLKTHQILICFEHTGLYSYPLASFLSKEHYHYCMVSALQIKKSLGIVRGKSDSIDAKRIAEYAYLRREHLHISVLPSDKVLKLQRLLSIRGRMVTQRAGYQTDIKQLKSMLKRKDNEILFKVEDQMISTLDKQIKRIEDQLKSIIESDQKLQKLFTLITSVKGVGFILATHFLVTTDCFTRFKDGRKFASYAGIAPFQWQSGTSVKGKSKVSHIANKKMKSLLNMSALSAINNDPELKQYYHSQVKAGKNKMSVLNVIRNKLVHRVFAVVKRETPYVLLHQHSRS